jgi:small subunit ribosomal protein S17
MNAETEDQSTSAGPETPASQGAPAGSPGEPVTKSRKPKTVVGNVHSDKMRKTRTVRVQRLVKHPMYGKYVRRRSTFYVHDEDEVSREGDTVLIAETRPISKSKRWRLVKVLTRGTGVRLSGRENEAEEAEEASATS